MYKEGRTFLCMKMMQEREVELAKIEADKINSKYESKANAVAMEHTLLTESDAKHKSFWGKFGDRIIGGVDCLSLSEN